MAIFDEQKTTVVLDSIGEVTLRSLTLGDTEKFFEVIAKADITDKEFVQEILFPQLVTPPISKEAFKQLPEEDLIKLAKAFIEAEDYTFKSYTDTGNMFSDFRKVITTSVEEEEKRIRKMFGPMIAQAERINKELNGRILPRDIRLMESVAAEANRLLQERKALDKTLDMLAHINLQPFEDLLDKNNNVTELFSRYWQDYYLLNEKITANWFSVLAAQNLLSQKDLAEELEKASQLSMKNAKIFTGRIKEINSYPEEQRSQAYRTSEITFFSIDEFESILQKIKKTIEIHSQLMFWNTRSKGGLAKNLERIAQGHMMGLLYMGLPNKLALGFQQLRSGSGIIDILLVFSNEYGEIQKVILELKVFEEGHQLNDGIEQTAQYMINEETDHGYRVIFNATNGELEEQDRLARSGKIIKDIIININLPNPSSLDK